MSGCVQRMPSGLMIVMKETPVSRRTCSAYGWSAAVGSSPRIAAATEGASATASAAAVTRSSAASSARSAALT